METPLSPFTFTTKPDPFEKYRYYLLAGLLVIFGIGLYLIFTPPKNSLEKDEDALIAGDTEDSVSLASANPSGEIVVDIAGGINKPGVYWIKSGSIIEDIIKAAGGFSKRADLDAIGKNINRAQELANHGKIYIPKIGDTSIAYTESSTNPTTNSSLININTADNEELDLLPGIGPILSQRIIDYRLQNNNFKSVDDLQNVPGIGDKLFEQIKKLVTI